MYEIRKHKSEIRETYLEKRRSMDSNVKSEMDKKIASVIMASATYRYADTLLMYYAKDDEINLNELAWNAIKSGKKVAFPRTNPEDRSMTFNFVNDENDFELRNYGLYEPKEGLPTFEVTGQLQNNVICIIPAVVYDKRGFRVGYGGGYYDRYLSTFKGTKVGVEYYEYVIGNVPSGRFDLAVDVLITEKGIYPKKQ
ncbi:MAG: 5-formyltetrahydrofolate cyclo-ligase [Clostridia bacterium]|nr:5-formyltetrahydrofolate cyclo-ligase [Clostridia bacterium]